MYRVKIVANNGNESFAFYKNAESARKAAIEAFNSGFARKTEVVDIRKNKFEKVCRPW